MSKKLSWMPMMRSYRIYVFIIIALPLFIVALSTVSTMSVTTSASYYNESGRLTKLLPMTKPDVQDPSVVRFVKACSPDFLNVEFTEPKASFYKRFSSCMTVPTGEALWLELESFGFIKSVFDGQSFASYATTELPRVVGRSPSSTFIQTGGILTVRNVRDTSNYSVTFQFTVEVNDKNLKTIFSEKEDLRSDKSLIISDAKLLITPLGA